MPEKSLDTSCVRNKTNTNYSVILSLKPQIPVFLPGVRVLFVSVMNTQWHHFLEILDRRQCYHASYPFLQTTSSRLSAPFLSSQTWPILPSQGAKVGELPSSHTIGGSVFVTIALCPPKEAICSLGGCECLITCQDFKVGSC